MRKLNKMGSEYVRLSPSERVYGARTLLQSQVSNLQLMKHFREYERLRKEELALKIELRTKIDHTLQLVESFIKGLPATHMSTEIDEKGKGPFSEFEDHEDKKIKSLDQELNEIKRKLDALK